MAEKLRTFDFSMQSAITSAESKGRNRYPWGDWFDGDIWKIVQGEDFETSPLMMERIIRTRASNKHHKAKVRLRHLPPLNGDSPAIVLQRTDVLGPSEAKKAELRAKRLAKKAAADREAQEFVAKHAPKKVNGTTAKKPTKRVAKVSS